MLNSELATLGPKPTDLCTKLGKNKLFLLG